MTTLSIIVPLYNGAAFLPPFMASVQGLLDEGDVELVMVNDGSTDGTAEMLDAISSANPSIRALHVENGGQGRAKNLGAAAASGRYLWFVDVDDLLDVRVPTEFLVQLSEEGIDILLTGFERYDAVSGCSLGVYRPQIASGRVASSHISRFDDLGHSAWNKVVSKKIFFLPGNQFVEGRIHEDLAVVPLWLTSSRHIFCDPVIRYRYGVRPASSIHGNYSRHDDLMFALSHLMLYGAVEARRLGPAIVKELFFYTLPRFASGLGKGCTWRNYWQCYSASRGFFGSIPRQCRRTMCAQLSVAQRIYVHATYCGGWMMPMVLAGAKRLLKR